MPEKTEAQKKAQKKYMEKFMVAQVRMERDKYSRIQSHAEAQGQSVNAYINTAIDEKMSRDDLEAGTAVQCGNLDIAAVAEATGERVEDFLVKAIQEAAGAVGASLPSNVLKASQDAAKSTGEDVRGFINRAIDQTMAQEAVESPTRHVEAGVVSLPSDTIKAAQEATGSPEGTVGVLPLFPDTLLAAREAAEAACESVPQFIDRAIEETADRDAMSRRMKGGKASE